MFRFRELRRCFIFTLATVLLPVAASADQPAGYRAEVAFLKGAVTGNESETSIIPLAGFRAVGDVSALSALRRETEEFVRSDVFLRSDLVRRFVLGDWYAIRIAFVLEKGGGIRFSSGSVFPVAPYPHQERVPSAPVVKNFIGGGMFDRFVASGLTRFDVVLDVYRHDIMRQFSQS